MELRQVVDFDEAQMLTLHYLMDLNNNLFLKSEQTRKFMEKHQMSTDK
jgi:hypothetical protein